MRPPYSRLFVVALLLVLLAALFSSAAAQTAPSQGAPLSPLAPDGNPAAGRDDVLTGRLVVIYGDPEDQSTGPAREKYVLIDAEGVWTEIELSESLADNPGYIQQLLGKEITVIGDLTMDQSFLTAQKIRVTDKPMDVPSLTGSQPWATVMCKFADISDEDADQAYFQSQYSNSYPGLGHYWKESSYGLINLNGSTAVGWVTLPEVRSYYINGDEADLYQLFMDCTSAADDLLYYPSFVGINLMFNDDLNGYAWGGGSCREIDGEEKCYRVTWEPPWAWQNNVALSHEMGHGFGLPHSSGMYGYVYDNVWDVMSDMWSNCDRLTDPTYNCLGQHTIAPYRQQLGWIPSGRIYSPPNPLSPVNTTVTLQRTTFPPGAGLMMARIPIRGYRNHYISVETRRQVGYDVKLPGEAVIIHEVWNGYAYVVDADHNGDTGDAGAMWLPGETYNSGFGSTIQVIQSTAGGGFKVKITTDGQTYDWWEQNDTRQTATDLGVIDFAADDSRYLTDPTIDLFGAATLGDVDFYRFESTADEYIGIDVWANRNGSPLDAKLDLYNESGTLLASNVDFQGEKDPYIGYQLPGAGVYYVRVSPETNVGGPAYLYDLDIRRATPSDGYEPNNSMAQATALAYGSAINATMPYGREADVDYYKFNGQVGDAIGIRALGDFHIQLSLIAPDGETYLDDVHCFTGCEGEEYIFRQLNQTGVYWIKVMDAHGGTWPAGGSYSLVVDKPVFVSSSQSGKVAGISFTPSDVLLNWPNAGLWQMFFDGSDVGITRNVASLGVTRWGDLILGFGADQPIPYLYNWGWDYLGATTIKTHDLVWFDTYRLGDSTNGDFVWLLDGSDVGLTVASEKIDAVAVDSDGRLLISLFGAGSVPGVNAVRDEDILMFVFQHAGADTTGTWSLYLQGSTIPGITLAQDVVGLAQPDANRLYMVMESAYTNIGGLTCGPTCVILRNAGTYSKIWDGRNNSFNFKVDAVELPNVNELYINPYP